MTDIVKRLRNSCSCNFPDTPCGAEDACRAAFDAAAEIERLRAALDEAEHFCELGLNSGEATHWEAALGDILQIARAALEGK